jgi:hypothetical protein
MKPSEWFVERRYLFLFGLTQYYNQSWAGAWKRRLRYTNNLERLFWTRRQAQAHADKLNGASTMAPTTPAPEGLHAACESCGRPLRAERPVLACQCARLVMRAPTVAPAEGLARIAADLAAQQEPLPADMQRVLTDHLDDFLDPATPPAPAGAEAATLNDNGIDSKVIAGAPLDELDRIADDCRESAALCNVDSAEGQHWVRLAVALETIRGRLAADHAALRAECERLTMENRTTWQQNVTLREGILPLHQRADAAEARVRELEATLSKKDRQDG